MATGRESIPTLNAWILIALMCLAAVSCAQTALAEGFEINVQEEDYPALRHAAPGHLFLPLARRLLNSWLSAVRNPAPEAATPQRSSRTAGAGRGRQLGWWWGGGSGSGSGSSAIKSITEYAPCDEKWTDYTPCEDPVRSRAFPKEGMVHRERHCPSDSEQLSCLIPPPVGYRAPLPWPHSRDEAWYVNVPHKHLTTAKADQNWIRYDASTEKFMFPGGGTMFHKGADKYLDALGELIPLTDGTIRTALDTGCGVGSFGAYMLSRNILTMSLAPRDGHEAQVQFALERGLPAMLGVLASKRLPYPARAFDLAHCSRCLIPWAVDGGRLLAEVDRVLRPGGFWVLTGPPIDWKEYAKGWQRTEEDLQKEQEGIEETARSLCWEKFAEKGMFGIWRKPLSGECLRSKGADGAPPVCPAEQNPDLAWYTHMDKCISRTPEVDDTASLVPAPWPARLFALPPRVQAGSAPATAATLHADRVEWASRVKQYKSSFLPAMAQGRYRNILDMNAGVGGFAAALAEDPVWVMNVSPVNPVDAGRDSGPGGELLGLIYERGLLGAFHDWCEAFSSYPRTYDLIHASGLFADWASKPCPVNRVLLEMDRLLRPEGSALIQDEEHILKGILPLLQSMRWDARLETLNTAQGQPLSVLVCVKKYWTEA